MQVDQIAECGRFQGLGFQERPAGMHFSAGAFLESTGPSADIDFLELPLRFRF
jgi:hypothetical protein